MPTVDDVLKCAAFGDNGRSETVTDRTLAAAATGSPRRRWLAAIVLGARGNYASAATVLEALRRQDDPLFSSLAATALASHRRQWGGHSVALALDGAALRRALAMSGAEPDDDDGVDREGAIVDALLGLAADNLGLGRLTAARILVARAGERVETVSTWRSRTRLGWVRAELELASGRASDAVSPAERALQAATRQGATRHRTKSALVLGAALLATGDAGERSRAARLVSAALTSAERHGWRSLVWPARLLTSDLDPNATVWNRSIVTEELSVLLRSTDPVGRRCALISPWVPI